MTVLQVLVSLTTFDLLFYDWQQLPFTCSYVPGKRPLMSLVASWIAVLCVVTPMLTIIISTVARMPELFLIYGVCFRRRLDLGTPAASRRMGRIAIDLRGSLRQRDQPRHQGHDVSHERSSRRREPTTRARPARDSRRATGIWRRVEALVHRDQLDQDLDDELQFHLSMQQRGATVFGNVAQIKEECRDQWTFVWLETFWQDVRYGVRQLRRAPGFTAVAALTLALGIGATTAIYSMCDTVLWRPVALPNLESLVMVLQCFPGNPHLWSPASPADIADIHDASTTIEGLASWSYGMANIVAAGGEPARVEQVRVTSNFFDVLGVQPAMGSGFQASRREVILSDRCWHTALAPIRTFSGSPSGWTIGKFTVVGVMPPAFAFPRVSKELWTPLSLTPEERRFARRTADRFRRPPEAWHALSKTPAPNSTSSRNVSTGNSWPGPCNATGPATMPSSIPQMLLGAAIFVLLICCANVANLQFARSSRRGTRDRDSRGDRSRTPASDPPTHHGKPAAGGFGCRGRTASIKLGAPHRQSRRARGDAAVHAGMGRHRTEPASAALRAHRHATQWSRRRTCAGVTQFASGSGGVAKGRRQRCISRSRADDAFAACLVAAEISLATVLLLGAGLMVRSFRANLSSGDVLEPDSLLTLRSLPA